MDIIIKKNKNTDFPERSKIATSVLFTKGKRTESFFTEDSGLYVTPRQQKLLDRGVQLNRNFKKWDALSSRVVKKYQTYRPSQSDVFYLKFQQRYESMCQDLQSVSRSFLGQFSVARLWNMSIVAAMLFGMVSMTLIYRYLGPGAQAAGTISPSQTTTYQAEVNVVAANNGGVNVVDQSKVVTKAQAAKDLQAEKEKNNFKEKAMDMVKGYPIQDMMPYILDKNQDTAAYIISIAKKESSWGVHVPVLNGQDCYNYWGYRGQRLLMGTGGHTCFNSRKDAVDTVAKRIDTLIAQGVDTPEEMVLWKCGSSCAATGGQAAANKWISDVNSYYRELRKTSNQ